MVTFYERLRELLDGDAADAVLGAGVSDSDLARWEAGDHPRPSEIVDLCRATNVSADWILGLSDDRRPKGRGCSLAEAEAKQLVDHVLWLLTEQLLSAVRENEEMSPAGKRKFMMRINDFDLSRLTSESSESDRS